MTKYMSKSDARRNIPFYDKCPNIHKSGSLTGMKKIYGWDTKFVIQIGSYYYNLKGYKRAHKYL